MASNDPETQSNDAQALLPTPTSLPDQPVQPESSASSKAITAIASEIENTSLADAEPVKNPRTNLCGVCNSQEAKYKCVRCYLPYCSMACSVVHKATHPLNEPLPSPPSPKETPQPKGISRAGTTGFKSPFAILEDSKELQQLFLQFPNLPKHLDSIHSATLRPVEDFSKQQQQTGQRKQHSWNQDKGLALGVEALGRARGQYGKDGEGVREYGRLVLQLLEREAEGGKEVIQKELDDENTRIIRQLLEMER